MPDDIDGLSRGMRLAMRGLAQSVSVISTRHRGERIAMAATAVNSLSLDPPSMMVAVNRSASIFSALRSGEMFCINILAHDQRDVADACGGRLKGEDRFSVGQWRDEGDTPVLQGAQARILCQQDGFVNYGSHGVFVGRVLQAETAEGVRSLIYADGRYDSLQTPA